MNRAIAAVVAVLLAWLAATGWAPPSAADAMSAFAVSEATVVTAAGNRYAFRVELAKTPAEREQGLQGRRALADAAGMLFDFSAPRPVAMWMKNTPLALDMIFIAADGRIVNIARDTTPGSLKLIESAAPVRGVLELKAGTTARLGIRPGDRVEHEIFR